MANTTVYVEKNGREHEVEVEFSVSIENDGIGPYEYWGSKEYDYGTDYAVLDEIYECKLTRSGRVERKEDAPECADEVLKRVDRETGKEYYVWIHYRYIQPNAEIESKVEEYVDKAALSDLIEEDYPDCDDNWDDRDIDYGRDTSYYSMSK